MANGPRDHESEYFHKAEREKLARLKERQEREKAEEEARRRKELHHHKCGKCGHDMDTRSFKGVEIEVCPACGAVLLDPGELEQLAGEDRSGALDFLGDLFGFRK